jgi:hypothetical protein
MDQCVGEIGAEENGDDQANDRLKHERASLETAAHARIGADNDKQQKAKA